jgi:putative ABC transport system substrate-binding protein
MKRREFITLFGGLAAAWPVMARSQSKTARIGYLVTGSLTSSETQAMLDAFRQGLSQLGYIEGQNIAIERRGAEGRIERLPELAVELVGLHVDVIVVSATPAGLAAKQATNAIPVVVTAMGDPIRDGLVTSLARPGGNITGTTFLGPELVAKRLALLKELLPTMSRIAALWQPGAFTELTTADMMKEAAEAANALKLQLELFEVRNPDQFDRAFSEMKNARAQAMFMFPSTLLFGERRRIVELAAQHRLPAMYNARESVQVGGLIGYGASLAVLTRRAATYVDRILKGAKPADLPVELPTSFELTINLKTARALSLEVPLFLQQRADEVIE